MPFDGRKGPKRVSAGLLMFRAGAEDLEVFLVHPGGPYFRNRDDGFWSVPKGLIDPGEEPLLAARREFREETGQRVRSCASRLDFLELEWIVQRGGKRVMAWAFEGDWPEGVEIESNTFPLEWPPRSGRFVDVPEIDRAEFFDLERARAKINPAQEPFLDRLVRRLDRAAGGETD